MSLLLRINLTHTNKKPQTTIISINGVDAMEVRTHSSDLTFLANKINKSSGKSGDGEYWIEVEY